MNSSVETPRKSEIGNTELKTACKPGIFALLRQHVHLEEALVGVLLNLDQIRDLDRGLDLRKIRSFSCGNWFWFPPFSLVCS